MLGIVVFKVTRAITVISRLLVIDLSPRRPTLKAILSIC